MLPSSTQATAEHAHPTQAMLDMLTIYREADKPFDELSVAIVGDIKHSRVARSDISAFRRLWGCVIFVSSPPRLCYQRH